MRVLFLALFLSGCAQIDVHKNIYVLALDGDVDIEYTTDSGQRLKDLVDLDLKAALK